MWLFLAFLIVPLIEIALFIVVGDIIGLWATLAIVVLTAILGTWLVRAQGLAALGQLRGSFEQLEDPTEPLAHGAMILFSGALLLTPGFFTDAVGFALLSPQIRRRVFSFLRQRLNVRTVHYGPSSDFAGTSPPPDAAKDTIEGEYSEVEPATGADTRKSGWTKH
ncbi:MAG: FxsA family protein [Pseudomonadota bacterium]